MGSWGWRAFAVVVVVSLGAISFMLAALVARTTQILQELQQMSVDRIEEWRRRP
jgi:hypothetical protein